MGVRFVISSDSPRLAHGEYCHLVQRHGEKEGAVWSQNGLVIPINDDLNDLAKASFLRTIEVDP